MKDSKIAAAATKVPFFAVPLRWLKGVARVFAFGAHKHGRENFYNGEDDPDTCDRYVGGMMRHLEAMQTPGGKYSMESCAALDEESGLPHIDHLMCGVIMLRARMTKAGALPDDPGIGKWVTKVDTRVRDEHVQMPLPEPVVERVKTGQWIVVPVERNGQATTATQTGAFFLSKGNADHAAIALNAADGAGDLKLALSLFSTECRYDHQWAVVRDE